ncbi:DNA polymerase III subunit beta [Ruegeria sp. ANG-R]|uniref:DNA polymerase III subunit beta n=1 Tax=Ruegeria sp. ANG-R TaxID=1577903 RepID=UPI00069051FF|nr:DNA polymerase III subunit beta [Ruegeria sp. ANG-R]
MNMQAPITAAHALIAASDLKSAMKKAAIVIERRNTIPVLGCVKIIAKAGSQTLTMLASDLDLYLRLKVPAEVSKDFACAVPAGALSAITDGASGPIGMSLEDDILTMTADDIVTTQRLISPPEDFPWRTISEDHEIEKADTVIASETQLHRLFHLGRHCISTEETRYYLNGAFLTRDPDSGNLRAVTTDGHRLGVVDTEINAMGELGTIVPSKTVDLLLHMCKPKGNEPVNIKLTEDRAAFDFGDVHLFSKCIDGNYPDYTRVIPGYTPTSHCSLSKSPVLRMMKLCGSIAHAFRQHVKLDPNAGTISFEDINRGKVSMPLQGDGESHIGFDLKHLAEQLKATPEIKVEFASAGDPARIKSEDPKAFWILMPVRL